MTEKQLRDAVDWVLRSSYLEELDRITLEEDPSKKLWFKEILAALDYEIRGGAWDNPKWAWEIHPWFEELNLTKDECEEWLQNEG